MTWRALFTSPYRERRGQRIERKALHAVHQVQPARMNPLAASSAVAVAAAAAVAVAAVDALPEGGKHQRERRHDLHHRARLRAAEHGAPAEHLVSAEPGGGLALESGASSTFRLDVDTF